jgi:hypothetical protein
VALSPESLENIAWPCDFLEEPSAVGQRLVRQPDIGAVAAGLLGDWRMSGSRTSRGLLSARAADKRPHVREPDVGKSQAKR